MSLSGHLNDPRSPVRAWFAERLPETRAMVAGANIVLRAGRAEPVHPRIAGAGASAVGLGVDYLIRVLLGPEAMPFEIARRGEAPILMRAGTSFVDVADRQIAEMEPWRRDLGPEERARLAELCLLLGHCDSAFRSLGGNLFLTERIARGRMAGLRPETLVRRLGEALVRSEDMTEMRALHPAAEEAVRVVRDLGEPRHLAPSFTQSRALGGADADLICGGALIELKATGTRRIVTRTVLWQLVGYLLADTEDRYAIRRLGVVAPRWRSQILWPADSLLRRLSCGVDRPLAAWRSEFAAMLAETQRVRLAAREERLRARASADTPTAAPLRTAPSMPMPST
jgi:hypothetical protein